MSFIEWDYFTSDVINVAASANTVTPIEDAQSVRFQKSGSPANLNRHIHAVPKIAPLTLTGHGVTRGRMRTLFRYPGAPAAFHSILMICMQSVRNLSNPNVGDYYALLIRPAHNDMQLRKFTGSTLPKSGTLGTLLASGTPTFTFGIGLVLAVELLWFLDIPNLGGVLFNVKTGVATDYSDLALVPALTFIDTSTPHLVSVSEGIGLSDVGSTGLFDYSLDNTELYSVGYV